MMRALFFSAILHIFIAIILCWQFCISNKILVGNNKVIHAYIYHAPFLISHNAKFFGDNCSLTKPQQKIFARGSLAVKASHAAKNYRGIALSQQPLAGSNDALLVMLHNLIQRQAEYFNDLSPVAGKHVVKVAFDLLPNGEIMRAAVQHSSGLRFFDDLAVQSVTRIQPVAAAGHFLHHKRHFVVAVEFA